MTARYKVIVTPKAQRNSRDIQSYLVENYSPEKADDWEERFLNVFLISLSKMPHHKIVRPATNLYPNPLRRALYRPTKSGASYYVYFSIEEFTRPNPEPTTDFVAGIVYVSGVRSASMAPLSDEEIDQLR
jgi:plasmid stabilization system protein ParE